MISSDLMTVMTVIGHLNVTTPHTHRDNIVRSCDEFHEFQGAKTLRLIGEAYDRYLIEHNDKRGYVLTDAGEALVTGVTANVEREPHEWIDPADLGFPQLKGMSCRKCGAMKPRDPESAAAPRCPGVVRIGLR